MKAHNTAKLTGNPDSAGWSQIHQFESIDLQQKSLVYLVLSVSFKGQKVNKVSDVNEVAKGRNILSRFEEEYKKKENESIFSSLKRLLVLIPQEFKDHDKHIEFGVISISDGIAYIGATGGTTIFLLRNGNLNSLVTTTANTEGKVVSGPIVENDSFLIASDSFVKLVPQNIIHTSVLTSAENFSDTLASYIHTKPDTGSVGGLLIKTTSDEVIPLSKFTPKVEPKEEMYVNAVPIAEVKGFRKVMISFLDKVISFLPEKKFVVRSDTDSSFGNSRKRKVAILAGSLLLFLLLISIFFGIKQRKEKEARSLYEGRITQIEHDLKEASNLATLDSTRARELVLNAKTSLAILKSENIKDDRIDALSESVDSAVGKIAGFYEVEPQTYLDLSLISSGLKGDDISISDGRMAILDREGKKLVSIKLATKTTEVVAGPAVLSTPTNIALYSDRNFVVNDEGIISVNDRASLAIKKDWEGDVLPAAYTGNLYLIEKQKGVVWRYPGDGGDTFGTKQNWFGAGVSPDLTDVTSVAVDGALWMMTDTGDIMKFSLGKEDNFPNTAIDKKVSFGKIFTNDEQVFLYILDPKNGRIVVLEKNGEYKAQYNSETIKDSNGFVVSEKDKKIILLNSSKLFSIEIKHL